MDTLVFRLELRDEASAGLGAFQRSLKNLQGSAMSVFGGFPGIVSGAASAITSFVSTAVSGLAKVGETAYGFLEDSVRAFSSYEDALIGVGRTTGIAGEELDVFGKRLRELALSDLKGQVVVEDLLQIAEVAGQLGIEGSANIEKFSVAVAKTAAALDLNAEQAATALAKLSNQYKVPIEDAQRMGDVLNEISQSTTATVSDLLNVGNRLAGAATNLGLSFEDSIALAGQLKNLGLANERGATAMSNLMLKLTKDTQGFIDALKLDAVTFREALENEPIQALQMMFDALKKVKGEEGAEGLTKVIDNLVGSGSGINELMLKLAGTSGELVNLANSAKQAYEEGTSVNDEFSLSMQTLSGQWGFFKGIVNEVKLLLGEDLVNAISSLFETDINPMLEQFREWLSTSNFLKEIWPGIIEQIKAGVSELRVRVEEWAKYLYENFPQIWQEIQDGVTSVVQAVRDFFQSQEGGASQAMQAWQSIKTAIDAVAPTINALKIIWDTLVLIIEGTRARTQPIFDFWVAAFFKVGDAIKAVRNLTQPLFDGIVAGFTLVKDAAMAAANFLKDTFGGIVTALIDQFKSTVSAAASAIKDVFGGAIDWIKKATSAVGDFIKKIFGAKEEVKDLGKEAYGESVFPDMVDWIDVTSRASEVLARQLTNTTTVIGTADQALQGAREAYEGLQESLSNRALMLRTDVSGILNAQQEMLQLQSAMMELSWAEGAAPSPSIASPQEQAAAESENNYVGFNRPSRSRLPMPEAPSDGPTRQSPSRPGWGAEGMTTNIVFEGTNIVDEQSVSRFARQISEVQREQGRRIYGR